MLTLKRHKIEALENALKEARSIFISLRLSPLCFKLCNMRTHIHRESKFALAAREEEEERCTKRENELNSTYVTLV